MKVLLLGADTEIGVELAARCEAVAIDCIPVDARKVDLTHPRRVARIVKRHRPDVLINLVDYEPASDSDEEGRRALELNRDGVHNLAKACRSRETPLIHLSTDCVFDGERDGPYSETDPCAPVDVYGSSRLEGEEALAGEHRQHLILRTGWTFSSRPDRYLARLVAAVQESERLDLDSTVQFAPTASSDVARVFVGILQQLDCGIEPWGVYHYCSADITTWYGFAEAAAGVMRNCVDSPLAELVPGAAGDDEVELPRSAGAQLSCRKILNTFGIRQRPWGRDLEGAVHTILQPAETRGRSPEPEAEHAGKEA